MPATHNYSVVWVPGFQYCLRMSDEPSEFEGLAKRYLDLWQDQVNALAADPNMADAVAKGIRAFSGGVATMMSSVAAEAGLPQSSGVTQTSGTHPSGGINEPASPYEASKTGAPASSSASSHSDGDIVKLRGRIAQLEKRVAQLEKLVGAERTAGPSASPAKRAGKPKSRPEGKVP
jgi:hypothetical protein